MLKTAIKLDTFSPLIKDHAGEKVVEEKKAETKKKEEQPVKSADKEVPRKTEENLDKGNVSEETMAQFSGTSKEVSSKFC